MSMMSMGDDVFEFIEAVGPLDGYTGRPNDDRLVDIYSNLVDEEYQEFISAPNDANKLNEAMDLCWVVLGYCIARGWDTEGAWKELTRSNMSKLQVDPATGKLKRRADGKILKPEGWKGPDFTPFINNKEVSS